MADATDLLKLQAEIDTLRTERDALISTLERDERETSEQNRLLIEEQDRFVSRLLEAHEREIGRQRLDLDEARTTADRLMQKHERDRTAAARLEEELARAKVELDRMREQRDVARYETRRVQHSYVAAQASIERLHAELAMAKSMLGDAMAGDPPSRHFQSVEPTPAAHEASRPPRESGIINRRPSRPRQSAAPAVARQREPTRRDTPRAAAAGGRTKESGPPSSR